LVFRRKEDWKEFLSDDAKKTLSDLFDSAKKHKGAYLNSSDVKVAQLWSAMVELKKDIDEFKKVLGKMQEPLKTIVSIGEAEKKRTIERLVGEIIRPTDKETQEATKKLVESLMKF
jgi:hypothetical protein